MTYYRPATPALDVQEAIQLVLDAATGAISLDNNGHPRQLDVFRGFAGALGAILHSDERPAEEILIEAIGGLHAAWAVMALEPTARGSEDELYGPYTFRDAQWKLDDLVASGYDRDRLAIKRLL